MTASKCILFVDDEPHVLKAYARSLRDYRDRWQMVFISCPTTAERVIQHRTFDAIVCDVKMPGLDGLELLARTRETTTNWDIPFVIVTGQSDRALKRAAMEQGAADLLTKPVDREDLISRLTSVLTIKAYADELKRKNAQLEAEVASRASALEASRLDIIWRLGKAAEFRDEDTGHHVMRVGLFSRAIALAMGLGQELAELIFVAAQLHDIGKIGIPDSILLKPGKLTSGERTIMQTHCGIGVSILTEQCHFSNARPVAKLLGKASAQSLRTHNPILEMATEIAGAHHEKWDGTGYPRKLKGSVIPLSARIVAIADVYDALRSRRPYKDAFTRETAIKIIKEESGKHFDPQVVDGFFRADRAIRLIEDTLGREQSATPVKTETLMMTQQELEESILQSLSELETSLSIGSTVAEYSL